MTEMTELQFNNIRCDTVFHGGYHILDLVPADVQNLHSGFYTKSFENTHSKYN